MHRAILRASGVCLLSLACRTPLFSDDAPLPNTQVETIPFTTPQQALESLRLPEGFRATLFSAEPQVNQPISMAFDERGRMWVAECNSYSDQQENFSDAARDRIIILIDANGDGVADERKVFWDQGRRLTSAVPGLGGVWALDAPRLLFFPDADRDDVPDGPPVVVLDGFNDQEVRHNIVNGLLWGPDGWLYGRHGILATSLVGAPGTAEKERTPINCGIWRYHPIRKVFEAVAHGTTNPWGMDFNEYGEMFMINTVIGHLWHVVPGAHYQRMYGSDFDPYLYRLLPQTADHFHWDTKEAWSDIRTIGVSSTTDEAGGGHAHCGLMIYQGVNWPAKYRNRMLTINLHGMRINCDRLDREGCGYVGRHEPDVLSTTDPWFRGIELVYGPDGAVYMADWSDIGECHDNDGIHRTSGRIFKIVYEPAGQAEMKVRPLDLRVETDEQLVARLHSENEWFVRQARLELQRRSMEPRTEDWDVPARLAELFLHAETPRIRVAALLTLRAMGATTNDSVSGMLQRHDLDEHTRAWLVRFLSESGDPLVVPSLVKAAADKSGLVRLYVASGLQTMPAVSRFEIAKELVKHEGDADDPWQPLMIWYGVHDAIAAHPDEAVALAGESRIPLVREFIIRRVTQSGHTGQNAVVRLLSRIQGDQRIAILRGMADGLGGVRRMDAPEGWEAFAKAAEKTADPAALQLIHELGAVFGDGRALEDLQKTALDRSADPLARSSSIDSLAEVQADGLADLLTGLLKDPDVAAAAVRGLAVVDPNAGEMLVAAYPSLQPPARAEVVAALASRRDSARSLLQAVRDSRIPQADVPPFQLRQILMLGDAALTKAVQSEWPDLQQSSQARRDRIAQLLESLSAEQLAKADLSHGRAIFDQSCAKCHKLYGEGATTGPDLTGAQRSNINYLLENIVDPSLTVAASFRMSILALTDGRVLNGVVSDRTDKSLQLQTPTERITIPLEEIDAIRDTNLSLMPEGQLDLLKDAEIRDLIGYLMSPVQVPKVP